MDFDPEGEVKVAAAVLYASTGLPDDQLLRLVRDMSAGRARGTASGERRGTGRTGATSPDERGSAPSTASTCSATTGRSETCSATVR